MLEGKVIAVTGAGRGIGRAIAVMAASRGARVVVNDLGAGLDGEGADAGPAEETLAAIRAAGGDGVINGDSVADPAGGERIVEPGSQAGDLAVHTVNQAHAGNFNLAFQ